MSAHAAHVFKLTCRLLLPRISKTVSLDKVAQLLLLYTSTCLKFAHATCKALSDKDGMPACKAASRMVKQSSEFRR